MTTSSHLARLEGPARLGALRAKLAEVSVDALLVDQLTDIHYLTGFPAEHAVALAVIADDWATLVTTEMFVGEASVLPDGWEAVVVPFGMWGKLREIVAERCAGRDIAASASTISHADWRALRDDCDAADVTLYNEQDGMLAGVRSVKSASEQEALRVAAEPLVATFDWLMSRPVAGRSEKDVAWAIEQHLRGDCEADALAFPVVVAAGPRGGSAHALPTSGVIEAGQLVTVDIGVVVGGYRSDMTRTFAVGCLGGVRSEQREAYETVRAALAQASSSVRSGVTAGGVHRMAADALSERGLDRFFTHGVGHGVGLELHELPFLEDDETAQLEAGQVVTVEPGVYIPGRFGVRIENTVAVSDAGCRDLTPFATDLIALG